MENFKFTNTWFNDAAKQQWEKLISQIKPKRILEIGSYEGASTCYLIQKLAQENSIEIHCIDAWNIEMGDDTDYKHYGSNVDMSAVESRFRQNTKLAIDSFINLYSEKINIFNAPLYQIYIKKISD